MGIQSLTSFIDENPQLLSEFRLCNTKVVIDGNNLCHCLYHDSGVSCLFGGDYDKFYRRTKEYFLIYRQCNITPIILFDGAYDYSDRKLKTTRKRAIQRLGVAKARARQKSHAVGRILPIMGVDVLQDVLRDMKISFVQCNFEADSEIAAIANYLKCPVLSLDSDFYVFDLIAGFIPLNLIDTNVQCEKIKNSAENDKNYQSDGKENKYLNCRMYHLNNLLKYFETKDRSVLPLFGILLGNDFVDEDVFCHFFSTIIFPKHTSRKFKALTQRHQKMTGLLWWLKTRRVETAIEEIISAFKKNERNELKNVIRTNLESYRIKSPTTLSALKLDVNARKETIEETKLKTMFGEELPQWFSEAFSAAILPPFLLNAVGQHRVMLLAQVEQSQSPSSYCTSRSIRRVIYGLLFSLLETPSDDKNATNNNICEFDRVNGQHENVYVEPITSLPNFGIFPQMVKLMDQTSATKLLCEVLEVDEQCIHLFPQNLQLVMLVTRFWAINSDPKVTLPQFEAFVLCVLTLSIFKGRSKIKRQVDVNEISPTFTLVELIECVSKNDARNVVNKLNKYRMIKQFDNRRRFDLNIVHNFTQLQTCLLFTNYLNRLLNFPFDHMRVDRIFNGTFLYNICAAVDDSACTSIQSLVEKLLGADSICGKLFVKLKRVLLDTLPDSAHLKTQTKKTRSKKRHKVSASTITGNKFSLLA